MCMHVCVRVRVYVRTSIQWLCSFSGIHLDLSVYMVVLCHPEITTTERR